MANMYAIQLIKITYSLSDFIHFILEYKMNFFDWNMFILRQKNKKPAKKIFSPMAGKLNLNYGVIGWTASQVKIQI